MASTPSASALSAVLRCKRPPASAYRLGLAYGAVQSIPRAEKPDNAARRGALWGFIWSEARRDTHRGTSVGIRLQCAELRARKKQESQIKFKCNFSTSTKSGLCEDTKVSQPGQDRKSEVTVEASESDCRVSLRVGDTPSVNLTLLSEKLLCVFVACKTVHNVSRDVSHHSHSFCTLKSTLLHLTMFVSDFLRAKLGFVWNKFPVAVNQLTGCDKCVSKHGRKNKTKKGLEPGT